MTVSTLKGTHVLWAVIGFLVAIFLANAIFIALALGTFPGQVVEKPYESGLKFNDVLKAKTEQAALGWTAEIEQAGLENGEAEITIRFQSAAGAVLHGLKVVGELRRPASGGGDRALPFVESADGVYVVRVGKVGEGVWNLTVTAAAATGENFTLEKRLILQ